MTEKNAVARVEQDLVEAIVAEQLATAGGADLMISCGCGCSRSCKAKG